MDSPTIPGMTAEDQKVFEEFLLDMNSKLVSAAKRIEELVEDRDYWQKKYEDLAKEMN